MSPAHSAPRRPFLPTHQRSAGLFISPRTGTSGPVSPGLQLQSLWRIPTAAVSETGSVRPRLQLQSLWRIPAAAVSRHVCFDPPPPRGVLHQLAELGLFDKGRREPPPRQPSAACRRPLQRPSSPSCPSPFHRPLVRPYHLALLSPPTPSPIALSLVRTHTHITHARVHTKTHYRCIHAPDSHLIVVVLRADRRLPLLRRLH